MPMSEAPMFEAGERLHTFQETVSEYLVRHKSVLDVISKFQEANARANRAIVKSITSCGCVEVHASRQEIPLDVSYWDLRDHMKNHLDGELCESCREILEAELGRTLFYVAAICQLFHLDLDQVLEDEQKRLVTLGVYNLT